jgi:hypothetical protein
VGGVGVVSDWRQHHADEAEHALAHPLVSEAIAELHGNLGSTGHALADYGIHKVAAVAAQVARAQALGFSPDLLRLSSEEADEEVLDLARRAAESGKPVWFISPEDDA